jgi:beta-1,4-mannosyl-glycoprotein beta-1,4-N-acetylglucosaminyltransferase
MPKKIDAFIFYNELEMLYYRLSILYPHMDAFILVESTHTFTGKIKQLYFSENINKFTPFLDKIIHIVITDMIPDLMIENNNYQPNSEQWKNERYQRNCIALGIENYEKKIGQLLNNEDLLFISDVDEIIDTRQMKNIEDSVIPTGGIIELSMDFYYYNIEKLMKQEWNYVKVVSYEYYKNIPTIQEDHRLKSMPDISNKIRLKDYSFHLNEKAGWHLSYFGDSKFIQNKIQHFSHQEYNSNQYTDLNAIEICTKKGIDLFGRNIEIKNVKMDENNYLPPFPTSTFSGKGDFPYHNKSN